MLRVGLVLGGSFRIRVGVSIEGRISLGGKLRGRGRGRFLLGPSSVQNIMAISKIRCLAYLTLSTQNSKHLVEVATWTPASWRTSP